MFFFLDERRPAWILHLSTCICPMETSFHKRTHVDQNLEIEPNKSNNNLDSFCLLCFSGTSRRAPAKLPHGGFEVWSFRAEHPNMSGSARKLQLLRSQMVSITPWFSRMPFSQFALNLGKISTRAEAVLTVIGGVQICLKICNLNDQDKFCFRSP